MNAENRAMAEWELRQQLLLDPAEAYAIAEHEYRQAVADLTSAIHNLNAAHSAYWLTQWNLQ